MAAAMKIDLFNHFFPKRYCDEFINVPGLKDIGKRVQNVPTIANLEARFRVMDEFGEYRQFTARKPRSSSVAEGCPWRDGQRGRIRRDAGTRASPWPASGASGLGRPTRAASRLATAMRSSMAALTSAVGSPARERRNTSAAL